MVLAVIALGLVLGMRHATDPDHVVAVTTIVSREKSVYSAAIIGGIWGVGHTLTILAVGSAIILLKVTIPPALGLTLELSVGFMLVVLGLLNLTGLMSRAMAWLEAHGLGSGEHMHRILGRLTVHKHGSSKYSPGKDRSPTGWQPQWLQKLGAFHVLRPLFVGIVHGLAGSAAVALLVLTTIRDPRWALVYLFVFGIGTVIGMMMITAAIALPFVFTLRHFSHLNQGLALASGAISLSFGLFLCYRIGISDGLFLGHPTWIPH